MTSGGSQRNGSSYESGELKAAREAKAAAKLRVGRCEKTTHSFRGHIYKKEHSLKCGGVKGIDSWRYVTVWAVLFCILSARADGVEPRLYSDGG